MPSSEYYHRQADTLLAMAQSINEPRLATLCRNLALEYKFLAEKRAEDAAPAADPSGISPGPPGAAEAD